MSTSSNRSAPRPELPILLHGIVAPGWQVIRLLWVNLEQDDDGRYITGDTLSVVYGLGDTPFESQQDYIASLIEYYQLLAMRVNDPHTQSQFHRLRQYLRPIVR
jgi:hypothetical protein